MGSEAAVSSEPRGCSQAWPLVPQDRERPPEFCFRNYACRKAASSCWHQDLPIALRLRAARLRQPPRPHKAWPCPIYWPCVLSLPQHPKLDPTGSYPKLLPSCKNVSNITAHLLYWVALLPVCVVTQTMTAETVSSKELSLWFKEGAASA